MAEETLSFNFQEQGVERASAAAEAIERLDSALDAVQGKSFDVPTADVAKAAAQVEKLKAVAGQAGSALATAMLGLEGHATSASTAARKLASVLDLVRNRADAARKAEDAAFAAAERASNRLPTALQPGAAPREMGGFQQLVAVVGRLFGGRAAGGLVEGASFLSRASDKLGIFGPLLAKGGALLAVGAAAAVAAAAALVVAAGVIAAKLLYAGAQMAIAATGAKEAFVGPLSQVLKDAQAAKDAYAAAIKVSVDLALDKDETLKRARALAGVGFRGAEIEVVLRAVADVSAGLGDEKAGAFQKVLEKLKTTGKFTQDAVNGLVEAGINSDLVLKKLSEKLGVSIDKVKEKLKAGTVDVGQGIQAIIAAAKEQTGNAAAAGAGTIPALFKSLKTLVESLFDEVDVTPLREALGRLREILSGPDGAALKAAITNLFGTLFKTLFAAFQGDQGNERLVRFINGATRAMESGAVIMEKAGPSIINILDALSKVLGGRDQKTSGGSWLDSVGSGILTLASYITYIIPLTAGMRLLAGAIESVGNALGFDVSGKLAAIKAAALDLPNLGLDMMNGLIAGIVAGTAGVVDAMVNAVKSAINAASAAIGRRSPARATIEMGADTSEGYEIGIVSRLNRVRAAGATMASWALGGMSAANDNAGGAVPAAAGAGGGNVTIIVQVQAGPGTTREQAQAAGDAAGEGAYRAWRRHMGRYVRDEERAA